MSVETKEKTRFGAAYYAPSPSPYAPFPAVALWLSDVPRLAAGARLLL